MKKITRTLSKLRKKNAPEEEKPGRITNETVAEHRERILAGGRRFKYPMQYARHRLVRNTIFIGLGALLLLAGLIWWQLYPAQNTSKFFYRITQIIPLPVAKIEGAYVGYDDYLMQLRSALHYLEREDSVNFNSSDGERQRTYQKREVLKKVEDIAYVRKIARERGISVSNKEVDSFIDDQLKSRKPAVSRQQYEQVLREFYDWSFDEYRISVRDQLLRSKVALAIDDNARDKADSVLSQLKQGADFATLARAQSDDDLTKQAGGEVILPKTNDDPDGVLAAVQKLQPNQISGVIEAKNGYYIVKLLENRESDVKFQRFFIALKQLDSDLANLRSSGKITEYISVPQNISPTQR